VFLKRTDFDVLFERLSCCSGIEVLLYPYFVNRGFASFMPSYPWHLPPPYPAIKQEAQLPQR